VPVPPSAAAALVRLPHAVLSHDTAARVHGIDLVTADQALHLTVPRSHGHVSLLGGTVWRRPLPPADVEVRADGVRITTVVRTLTDLARRGPVEHAVVAADSALRSRLTGLDAVQQALRAQRGPGATGCRQVAPWLDPASESVLESLLRVVLLAGPWPPPVTQHEVRDSDGLLTARLDFAWPLVRLAVEADGFAFHSDRAAYRRDRERLNRLVSLGWSVLRFTYEDVVRRPDYVTALVAECLRRAR
jgi:very-short-patch-repair endonuclease